MREKEEAGKKLHCLYNDPGEKKEKEGKKGKKKEKRERARARARARYSLVVSRFPLCVRA